MPLASSTPHLTIPVLTTSRIVYQSHDLNSHILLSSTQKLHRLSATGPSYSPLPSPYSGWSGSGSTVNNSSPKSSRSSLRSLLGTLRERLSINRRAPNSKGHKENSRMPFNPPKHVDLDFEYDEGDVDYEGREWFKVRYL